MKSLKSLNGSRFLIPKMPLLCQSMEYNMKADFVKERTIHWLSNWLTLNENQLVQFEKLNISALVGYKLPHSSENYIQVYSDFVALLFWLEDIDDKKDFSEYFQPNSSIMQMFEDILSRADLSSYQTRRYRKCFDEYKKVS